jgi:hypothetical protein
VNALHKRDMGAGEERERERERERNKRERERGGERTSATPCHGTTKIESGSKLGVVN